MDAHHTVTHQNFLKTLPGTSVKGLCIGCAVVFPAAMIACLPPMIVRGYLADGLYNTVLFMVKTACNRYAAILLPLFFAASVLYAAIKPRSDKAYAAAVAFLSLCGLFAAGYWLNRQLWFPDFLSGNGFLLNSMTSMMFLVLGALLYLLTKRVAVSMTWCAAAAISVFFFVVGVNGLFLLSNRRATLSQPTAPARKIVLIGVDAATWDIMLPLVARGRLPNIARLMQNGSYGRLASTIPTLSPIIWTSIATGKVKEKHGISDFLDNRTRRGEKTPFTSNMRKTKAIWNILSQANRTVGIVGWWVTWPAEPVNGSMVSSYVSLGQKVMKGSLHADVPNQTYPESLFQEIAPFIANSDVTYRDNVQRVFGDIDSSGLAPNIKTAVSDIQWVLRSDGIFANVGLYVLQQKNPDFTATFIGGVDAVGHRFWKFMEPRAFPGAVKESESKMFGNVIINYYELVDDIVGRFLAASDEKTTFIIVSDHGMHASPKITATRYGAEISGEHEDAPAGIFIISGPGVKKNHHIKTPVAFLRALYGNKITCDVFDVTPTILYLLGLPTAEDMDGEPITSILTSDYLSRHSIAYIRSYDVHDAAEDAAPVQPLATPYDDEIKKRLKGLGYIQ